MVKNVIARPSFPARPVRPAKMRKSNVSQAVSWKRTFRKRGRKLTNAVDVAHGALREVVVDDQLDALEVDSPAHHVRADEHPDLSFRKLPHGPVALVAAPLRMDAVGAEPVEEQLGRELFGALDRLDKDEDWRCELAGGDEGAEGEELVVFGVDEGKGLGDGRGGGLPGDGRIDIGST